MFRVGMSGHVCRRQQANGLQTAKVSALAKMGPALALRHSLSIRWHGWRRQGNHYGRIAETASTPPSAP